MSYFLVIIFIVLIIIAYIVVVSINHNTTSNLEIDSNKLHPILSNKKYGLEKKKSESDLDLVEEDKIESVKESSSKKINNEIIDEGDEIEEEEEEEEEGDDENGEAFRDKKNDEKNMDNAILSNPNDFDVETLKKAAKRMGNTEKGKFVQKALDKKLNAKDNNRGL